MSHGFDPAWTGRSKTEIFDYGRERHRVGELAAAEAAYRHFLTLGAEEYEADAQHLLGLVLYHQQRSEEAIPHITKAIELRGDYVRYYNNAALAYLSLGRLEEAEATCRRALPLDPAYALVRGTLGIILRAAGRLDEAELWTREALQLDPGHIGAHCQLGFILSGLGRLDEAVVSFRAALALDADMPDAHLGLCEALRLLGHPTSVTMQ
ncbi:MAG: tetratricopeptide repeat protein [Aliidongia sp.]